MNPLQVGFGGNDGLTPKRATNPSNPSNPTPMGVTWRDLAEMNRVQADRLRLEARHLTGDDLRQTMRLALWHSHEADRLDAFTPRTQEEL